MKNKKRNEVLNMSTVNVDIELLKENLKQKGYKLTPQRRAIAVSYTHLDVYKRQRCWSWN